jgi:hypothetical protein
VSTNLEQDDSRIYTFRFNDTSGNAESVAHQFVFSEGVTYDDVLDGFLGFLGTVYGYDIRLELRRNGLRFPLTFAGVE